MAKRIATCLSIMALCTVTACAPAPQPNMLLIVIDALRADRLGCYGNADGLTPFLDSLADRAYVFHRAYAQSSWTSPSVASLLTSRYQSQHGIIGFGSVLSEGERTLPEILQRHGYATAGFSANILTRTELGFAQGYDLYRTFTRSSPEHPSAPRFLPARSGMVNREALSWLDRLARRAQPTPPVFVFVHYMEPHNPYDPPEWFLEQVLTRRGHSRPDLARVNRQMAISNVLPFTDEMVRAVEDVYDAEVMNLDAHLRELFAALGSRGFLDNAVVVLTADHGEEFKDHGLVGHRKTLYEEVVRVPLLLLSPQLQSRVDVTTPVSLIDIAPTLLKLAGLPAAASFEGRSLLTGTTGTGGRIEAALHALWKRTASNGRPAFTELVKRPDEPRPSPHERAVVLSSRKLIVGVDGEREFFDLDADPGETDPAEIGEAERAPLIEALARFEQHATTRIEPSASKSLDEETREQMRALGYAE